MPPTSPHQIELTVDERAALVALIRPTSQARMVLRARIVLRAADGGSNAGIARDLDVCQDTVRKWRRRYARDRLGGLADAHRCGRKHERCATDLRFSRLLMQLLPRR